MKYPNLLTKTAHLAVKKRLDQGASQVTAAEVAEDLGGQHSVEEITAALDWIFETMNGRWLSEAEVEELVAAARAGKLTKAEMEALAETFRRQSAEKKAFAEAMMAEADRMEAV